MDSAATAPSEPHTPATSGGRRVLAELAAGYTLILIVIWIPRPWQQIVYFLAAAFIVAASWLSFPGGEALGLRPKKFFGSIWILGAALLASALSIAAASHLRTLHGPTTPFIFFNRYAGYMLFACVQQFLLQDFFLLRLLRPIRRPRTAALAAAAIFSLAHLPNPILTVVTFVWGLLACLLFLRYRNLYVLAVAHAILGVTVALCVPGPEIRNMRVGLGYLRYDPHRLHQSNYWERR
jgi:membrane protease YdiL (CAAX protease family)